MNFIGLELSPASVELSYQAAKKYGLDVKFYECSVCEGLPRLPGPGGVHLAYSSCGLEQMPRIFPGAVKNMLASSSRGVVFFEPAPELYPWNLRGIVSRLRALHLDRLRGLLPAVKRAVAGTPWSLTVARRMQYCTNPLNEACEIHVRHSGFSGRAGLGNAAETLRPAAPVKQAAGYGLASRPEEGQP